MAITSDESRAFSLPPKVKLGEELPVFCEKCGYSLHGLVQVRCEHCDVLQFHCPECGHHQPINTLRPAAQRIIGRLRALWLGWVVFFKLNFFGWLLFGWAGMGASWSFSYNYVSNAPGRASTVIMSPRPMDWDSALAFTPFALAFSTVGRMLLLRWRSGAIVGLVLAALVTAATALGVLIDSIDLASNPNWTRNFRGSVWTGDMLILMTLGACVTVLGSAIVWPIWVLLVRAFLPRQTGPLS